MAEQKEKQTMKPEKVRFPIGAKLVIMISVLLLIALGTITMLVTWFGSEEVQITAEENNRTVNAQAASAVEKELMHFYFWTLSIRQKVRVVLQNRLLHFILSGIRRLLRCWLLIPAVLMG